jgi:hypothetical protein
MQALSIRVAKAVNHARGGRGPVWADRYHARALTTPQEVRNALVYVLQNVRKHVPGGRGFDPCSSATWFTGWREPPAEAPATAKPVATPRAWLAAVGWQRHGFVGIDEVPAGGA